MEKPSEEPGYGRREFTQLTDEGGRARLVVFAAEVGGRWSNDASQFVRSLAWAKAQSAPESTHTQVAHAWNRRWRNFFCTAAKVVREHFA